MSSSGSYTEGKKTGRRYPGPVSRLYVSSRVSGLPAVERARRLIPGAEYREVAGKDEIPDIHRNAETLFISPQSGRMVGRCPGTKGHFCCNYLTINLYTGCTIGCTYCIMRWYLNFEPVTVFADPAPGIDAVKRIAEANPDTVIRAGTGEVGDSLLFDPLFDLSRPFIEELSDYANVYFELKTKTDYVDHILSVRRKGNAVIAFSLNPQPLADAEEPFAAPVAGRLEAARRAVEAGYNLAFHFDPIIFSKNWEREYFPLAEALGTFPREKIVWISMGTVRYPPELKDKMADRPYLYDEFVRCRDGKFRYLQVKRVEMYRKMLAALRAAGVGAPVYLCMESAAVWRAVFGALPAEMSLLQPIFNRCVIPE